MLTDFTSTTWDEALRGFVLHYRAVRAPKTAYFYEVQLRGIARWAQTQGIALEKFGKRHLDEYLVTRAEQGKSQTTLHHDALTVKVFLKWCAKNDVITRSLLADYEVRAAPKTFKYMPTQEDMAALMQAVLSYYDPGQNADARFLPAGKRGFHRDRNFALILVLLDTACRIGEVLSLQIEDYQAGALQLTVRQSKGREPRTVPLTRDTAAAVATWLKVRARVMSNVPKDQDEGWLFVNELGSRIDEHRFLDILKRLIAYAGLSGRITLHSLRRYSLNKLSKVNPMSAKDIAGHKNINTTMIYTQLDADFNREVHAQAGVVSGILGSKRVEKRKRLV